MDIVRHGATSYYCEADPMTPHDLLAAVTPWLHKLAHKYAVKHGLDRDDVFQASALLLIASAPRFDPTRSKPSTWAAWQVRGAVSRLLNERVRFGRVRLAGDDELSIVPDKRTDATADHPHLDHLAPALATLSGRHRRVLELRHVDGCEQTEVARRFGVSRQRVHQMQKAATAELRTAILGRAHPAA